MRSRLAVLLLSSIAALGCAASRADGTESCVPGEELRIGCAASCGVGVCESASTLRVCDGPSGVELCREGRSGALIVTVDSSACGGVCPYTRVLCPPSGSVTVVSFGSCQWDLEHRGVIEPGARAACEPGVRYEVGCADGCGVGVCTGSPELRVCDGESLATPTECIAASGAPGSGVVAAAGRRSCDRECPMATLTCPESGSIIVSHFTRTERPYLCDWELRESPEP